MTDPTPTPSYFNPIRHRGWSIWVTAEGPYQYAYAHDEHEPDTRDDRHGYAHTVEDAKANIDEYEAEMVMP